MPVAVYERGGVPSDPGWNIAERASEPGPGHYDSHPFLTPATHSTSNSQYFPDRKSQYPGGQMYSQQPMWLSLPLKERNRFWIAHRNELEKRKKTKNKKAGEWMLTKSLDDLIYTNRDLPMTSFARVPPNLGNIPLFKRAAGDPSYEQHDTKTSTLSFAERRELQRRFRVTRGMGKLQRKVLEVRRSISSVAGLARDKERLQNTKGDLPSWYIPPLPREEGLGEMMASKSQRFYKTHARCRDIDGGISQKDCIGTRWTGLGNAMDVLAPVTGKMGTTMH